MEYELISLASAVELVSRQKNCEHRESIRIRGNKIMFDIEFKSRKLADDFSFAWAYSIRQFFDGDFILFLHYMDDERLIPFPKMYKAGPAPEKRKVVGYQRPEKRLPFY
jgi:hypothetical protein